MKEKSVKKNGKVEKIALNRAGDGIWARRPLGA